jgi:DNA-binding response OmpR family regulator
LNIVVVEDEAVLCEEIVLSLHRAQHEVIGVGSAAALFRHLSVADVDMIVLDLDLTDEDGLGLATHLQEKGYGLVILSSRSSIEDRIIGLRQGDAYLAKPVDLNLLNATLMSVFRRLARKPPAIPAQPAVWRLDGEQWVLYSPDGRAIPLTAKEMILLNQLLATPCIAVSRHNLNHALHPECDDLDYRLEVLISRLRHKVSQITTLTLPLKTVHGIGYAFICVMCVA